MGSAALDLPKVQLHEVRLAREPQFEIPLKRLRMKPHALVDKALEACHTARAEIRLGRASGVCTGDRHGSVEW